MLISQCIFTNLQVVGGGRQWAEKTYNLSVNGLKVGEGKKKKKNPLPCLLKQLVKNIIPSLHISSERLYGRSHFQLKSHLRGS